MPLTRLSCFWKKSKLFSAEPGFAFFLETGDAFFRVGALADVLDRGAALRGEFRRSFGDDAADVIAQYRQYQRRIVGELARPQQRGVELRTRLDQLNDQADLVHA